jgi:hypothetical protein
MKNLNENLKKLFANYEGLLNAKVTKCEIQKTEDGTEYYEIPVPVLASGGATVVINGKMEAVALEAPAKASFDVKKVHPHKVFYRIAFSIDDAAKADSDESYFNALVEPTLKQAIARYESTFGGGNVLRYGKAFCQLEDVIESGEYVEFRLVGNWASTEPLEQ